MKIARILFAVVLLAVGTAACDSNPVAPDADDASDPIIGSGVGT